MAYIRAIEADGSEWIDAESFDAAMAALKMLVRHDQATDKRDGLSPCLELMNAVSVVERLEGQSR